MARVVLVLIATKPDDAVCFAFEKTANVPLFTELPLFPTLEAVQDRPVLAQLSPYFAPRMMF